jgi:hypothetical protein
MSIHAFSPMNGNFLKFPKELRDIILEYASEYQNIFNTVFEYGCNLVFFFSLKDKLLCRDIYAYLLSDMNKNTQNFHACTMMYSNLQTSIEHLELVETLEYIKKKEDLRLGCVCKKCKNLREYWGFSDNLNYDGEHEGSGCHCTHHIECKCECVYFTV